MLPDTEFTRIAGLTYRRRADGIHIYEFADFLPATMDAWKLICVEQDQLADGRGEHVRSLYRVGQQVLTIAAFTRAVEVARQTPPTLRESMALVAARGLVWIMLGNLTRRLPDRQQQAIRIFGSEAEALAWLDERATLLKAQGRA